ncbi:DUF5335 family protein [Pontibacter sp. G13]|uniref:DUF5335 family protein n=1 Tax=Pontibacter sp. G13 TaxID=3074898 RepID=UPI00288BFC1D|nr:DUF5335 family protein [Pontibacter sp. G13]WNJ17746.1 DUF5335 family protein [Pontibacter sp. G13]
MMGSRQAIPYDEWQNRLQTFTSGNEGRMTILTTQGAIVARDMEFVDAEYDPVNTGNQLIITLKNGNNIFRHSIYAPVEMQIVRAWDGEVGTFEIIDQNGEVTQLSLIKRFE